MALINCPECGREISDKADKCPNCGCPRKEFENKANEGLRQEASHELIKGEEQKINVTIISDESCANAKLPQSGLGIAGMVIGIVAVLFSCALTDIGGLAGVVGLILSIGGFKEKDTSHGLAIAGIVLNSVATFTIFMVIVMGVIANSIKAT